MDNNNQIKNIKPVTQIIKMTCVTNMTSVENYLATTSSEPKPRCKEIYLDESEQGDLERVKQRINLIIENK